jgi:uncharacterized membrane protein
MVNVTAWSNMSSFVQLFTAPNQVTDYTWGYAIFGILYVLFFVTFSMASRPPKEDVGLFASSLLMAPISFGMAIIGMIYPYVTVIPIVLAVIGIMIVKGEGSG